MIASQIGEKLISKNENVLLKMVYPEKQRRIQKYHRSEDRQRGILGEILLKYILEDYGIKEYKISCNKFGKPYLPEYPHIHFNISHSGKWVMCVVNEHEIGVDIQEIQMDIKEEIKDLSSSLLSIKEQFTLDKLRAEKQLEKFFYFFTQKEAYVKCIGKNMNIYDDFRFLLSTELTLEYEEKKYYFSEIKLDPKYKAAVCSIYRFSALLEKVSACEIVSSVLNYGMHVI